MEQRKSYFKGFLPYALAAFLVSLVGGFSAVLGPAFVQDIGIAYNNTTWTALAQAMSTAACAPILGKMGDMISRYARGEDDSPVASARDDAKSVGNGFTFRHDLVSKEECRVGIEFLSEEIGRRLRSIGMKCSTVQLSIKDDYLRTIQRQRTINSPTDISREISARAYEILLAEWSEGKPIRMLTVTATGLVHAERVCEQLDMFAPVNNTQRDKNKKIEETIDRIRQKHGWSSVLAGSVIDSDIGIYNYQDFKGKK